MKNFKTMAHIHTLDGEMREITVLKEDEMFGHTIPNAYIVEYNGVKCTAIYNVCNGHFYADDKYGIIKES